MARRAGLRRIDSARVGKASESRRSIALNRRARHDYHVLDELECGIVLQGTEVKVLRQGRCSIAEAYVAVKGAELFLIGAHVPEYAHGNVHNHAPTRERKLLVHRRELTRWHKQVREKGITLIPLEVYFAGSRVKVAVGLCRGKKLHDKREVSRERTDRREMERALRRQR